MRQEPAAENACTPPSWIGSAIVIAGAVFLLLTVNEGRPNAYQRQVDSLFHNWLALGAGTIAVWIARRGAFGRLPSFLRALSGLVLSLFILFTVIGLLTWQTLWDVLKPFGIVQYDAQAPAIFGLIGLWASAIVILGVHGILRWFRKRYQHHGVAIGFGPLYFYFRRRRTS